MNVKLIGHDFKCLQVELAQQEKFFCEKGALIYYEEGITSNINVFDKGVAGLLKRKLTGESIFQVELCNTNIAPKKLVIAGRVGMLPVNLKQISGGIICRAGFYVGSSDKVDIDVKLNITSLIGGTGLIMQKITGFCTVFLDVIGTPITLNLEPGQTVFVDEKSFICMNADMQSRMSSHFSGNNLLGGEGLTTLKITGPGTVYLTSVNFR
ncbi:AIM24 family protein [Chitinophaga nivalis]|uniref:AIM24 family protein n=1 Tax=Chitinophaga nivalis TaxID=2991709 RepID=A0ABT3IJ73_9BACT|nr:AIM24 family protein [Chitinophaga nivalis]MCW3466316.1 AIM24 family protein [Chitinophaga nivalis]MCW3483993.1 AIM24 family protein [Chitinophaga nivalis]